MSGRPNPNNGIVGGDTPFVPFSEADRMLPKGHRPLAIEIDGKPATRELNVAICAMTWRMIEDEPDKSHLEGLTHRQFMEQFIAGANHDMRALGVGPLLSMAEVEGLANHPAIVAAVRERRPK